MDSTNSANLGGEVYVLDENFQIRYQVVGSQIEFQFSMYNNFSGWMGLGFHEFMFPADTIVVWMDNAVPYVWDAYNPGIPTLTFFPGPSPDDNPIFEVPGASPYDNKENVEIVNSSVSNGVTSITVRRDLVTGDIFDFALSMDRPFRVVTAYNSEQGFINEPDANQPTHTAYGSAEWVLR